MKFAKEGLPFIFAANLLSFVLLVIAYKASTPWLWGAWVMLAIVTAWVHYFFRDPEREGARGPDIVISPADGKVVSVVEVHEPAFIRGPAIRISVFMNIFSVHVNRYPVTGDVRYVQYNPGKFLNAAVEKASLENEQSSVGIETPKGRVLVRQIAGLIARRIVTYSRTGDVAQQGVRFGIIRFGSRVDVFLPTTAKVRVKVGDQAQAGLTVLADS
jgi:phosphatidylserine decarboxylase